MTEVNIWSSKAWEISLCVGMAGQAKWMETGKISLKFYLYRDRRKLLFNFVFIPQLKPFSEQV